MGDFAQSVDNIAGAFSQAAQWVVNASPNYIYSQIINEQLAENPSITVQSSDIQKESLLERLTPDSMAIMGKSFHIGGDGKYLDDYEIHDLNESNPGLAFQWELSDSRNAGYAYIEAGAYENSHNNISAYVAAGYESDMFGRKDFGVGVKAGLITGYSDFVSDKYLVGNMAPAIVPYARIGEKDGFHADIGILPTPGAEFEDNDGNTWEGSKLAVTVSATLQL